MNIKETDKSFVAGTYGRFDLCLMRGEGAKVWDDCGNEYIDMGAGIAVNTFGYSDGAWADAVCEQVRRLQHTSNLYLPSPVRALLKCSVKKQA